MDSQPPNESGTVRSLRLYPFGYTTLVLAVGQDSYNFNVQKSDFTQAHEDTCVLSSI